MSISILFEQVKKMGPRQGEQIKKEGEYVCPTNSNIGPHFRLTQRDGTPSWSVHGPCDPREIKLSSSSKHSQEEHSQVVKRLCAPRSTINAQEPREVR